MVTLISDDQIDDHLIDFQLLQWHGNGGGMPPTPCMWREAFGGLSYDELSSQCLGGRFSGPQCCAPVPAACALGMPARLRGQKPQAACWLSQEPLFEQIADNAFDGFQQTVLTFTAARSSGAKYFKRRVPCRACRINTTCRRDSPSVRAAASTVWWPETPSAAQGPDNFRPRSSLLPSFVGQGNHSPLDNS